MEEHVREFIPRLERDIERWKKDAVAFDAIGASGEAMVVRGWIDEGQELLSNLWRHNA